MRRAGSRALVALLVFSLFFASVAVPALPKAKAASTSTCTPTTCQEVYPSIPVMGEAPVQRNPQAPVFGGYVYVANEGSDTVSVIMGMTNVANVSVGSDPLEPAFDYDSGSAFVPNAGGDTVSVLSGVGLDSNVQVGQGPTTPAYDPMNGYVYVPNTGGCTISFQGAQCGNTVSVISGTSVVATLTVGTAPEEPAVNTDPNSPFYGYVYVPSAVQDKNSMGTVTIISGKTDQVVTTLELGLSPPSGAFFDEKNDYVYVGPYVMKGTTMLAELTTSCNASCVLNTNNGDIYSLEGTTLFIISGTESTSVFCEPCGSSGTFDPINGWLYAGWAIAGVTPFATLGFSTEGSGIHDDNSFNPNDGSVYASCGGCYYLSGNSTSSAEHFGNVVFLMGNVCLQPGPGYYYNATYTGICNGAGSGIPTLSTTAVTATSTGVNGSGTHIYSIVTSGSIPMASGNWTASGSKIVGQSGGATISFTLSGQSGTNGTATIQILKTEIVFLVGLNALGGTNGLPTSAGISSWQPQLFIDGQLVNTTSITQDSNYVYVTFPIHFSTHQITLLWRPASAASTTPVPEFPASAVALTALAALVVVALFSGRLRTGDGKRPSQDAERPPADVV